MRRRLIFLALFVPLLPATEAHARRQHVSGYVRSNGTYVHGYTREVQDDPAAAVVGLILLGVIAVAVFINQEIETRRWIRSILPPPRPVSPPPRDVPRPSLPPVLPILAARCGRACGMAFCRALSFQWVAALPDWGQPIVWGFTIASPLLGLLVRWKGAGRPFGDGAVFLTFVAAGSLVGGLTYDVSRSRGAEKRADRIRRFRSVLSKGLRPENAALFSFAEFTAAYGMPREEAIAAAEGLYRNFSRKVAADGIVTDAERRHLDTLANALDLRAGRCRELEAEGKSDAYRAAVAEAKADGIVTEDEAKDLELLRRSLAIRDVEHVLPGVVDDESA